MSSVAAASSTGPIAVPLVPVAPSVSPRRFRVACVQLTSDADVQRNIEVCSQQIRRAAAEGCTFIATPENTGRMANTTQKAASAASSTADSSLTAAAAYSTPSAASHPVLLALQALAVELRVFILVGSIAVRVEGEQRVVNRSYLLGPTTNAANEPIASYDKIHMFDVPSLNGAESYLESARVLPGSEAVLADLPGLADGACLGLTICYDLRFPQLYRALAQAGANILTVPSAFTVVTGQAHWHALLRARAIETGCYVLAPAQSGTHPGDRKTYGHSLIVSPWGEVLADAALESPTYVTAEIDLDQCDQARRRIPSLQHDRPFTVVKREAGAAARL